MNILELITSVGEESGYSVDTTAVIGSTNQTTAQLRAMAQRIIAEMADTYPWPALNRTATITLVAGQSDYFLPGDFSRYHFDTFWNSSTNWRVFGPLSEIEYAEFLGSAVPAETAGYFTIQGVSDSTFTVYPTPGTGEAGETIIFRYVSARPVRPQTWVTGLSIAIGDYSFYDGNYYSATSAGTTGASAPVHTSGSDSDGGVTWAYYSGAYETFQFDTDIPVLSDRILRQGLMERFGELHGITIAPRYQAQLAAEYAKTRPGRILYAGGEREGFRARGWKGRIQFGG